MAGGFPHFSSSYIIQSRNRLHHGVYAGRLVLPFLSCLSGLEHYPTSANSACTLHVLADVLYHPLYRFTSLAHSPYATSLVSGAGSTRSSSPYGSDPSASRHTPSSSAVTSQKSSQRTSANTPPSAPSSTARSPQAHGPSPTPPSFPRRTARCCTLAPCKAHVSSR